MYMRNIVLTGLPRSGTTLACYLLNKLPNTVALFEPIKVEDFRKYANHEDICNEVRLFFCNMRKLLTKDGEAISRQINGIIPTDPYNDTKLASGLRKDLASKGKITITKSLSQDFLLCIKHPVAFTALMESLLKYFPCYAIVRNPLSVLASWNSLSADFRQGYAPVAESIDSSLSSRLRKIVNIFDRQIFLVQWYFEKYYSLLPPENIITYEKIISSGGSALSVVDEEAITLCEKLENRNTNILYNRKVMRILSDKLLNTDSVIWEFYSKESVQQLMMESERQHYGGESTKPDLNRGCVSKAQSLLHRKLRSIFK